MLLSVFDSRLEPRHRGARGVITRNLQQMEAESGLAALTILKQETRCNLMIVDLAWLSGLETLRLARRSQPELRVLFTSGYADLSRSGDTLRDHPYSISHSRSKAWPQWFRPYCKALLLTNLTTWCRSGVTCCEVQAGNCHRITRSGHKPR